MINNISYLSTVVYLICFNQEGNEFLLLRETMRKIPSTANMLWQSEFPLFDKFIPPFLNLVLYKEAFNFIVFEGYEVLTKLTSRLDIL